MQKLFQVSDQPDLKVFEPVTAPMSGSSVEGLAVWAVDDDHLAHYLFPADCPRITLRGSATTSPLDRKNFFPHGHDRVIAVEMSWYKRLQSTPLYVYEFSAESFIPVKELPGFYIAGSNIVPVAVHKISRPLETIVTRGYKLRLLDSLFPLREAVLRSTVHYSMLSMQNCSTKLKAA